MNKKVLKIFLILSVIITYTFLLNIPYTSATVISNIVTGAEEFLNMGDPENAIDDGGIKTMSDSVYNVLFVIAVVLAVGIGIFLGIQFVTNGAVEKAKIKESLIAYVAGCVVVFGAFTIWQLIVNLLQGT